jgi:hypothetical protein
VTSWCVSPTLPSLQSLRCPAHGRQGRDLSGPLDEDFWHGTTERGKDGTSHSRTSSSTWVSMLACASTSAPSLPVLPRLTASRKDTRSGRPLVAVRPRLDEPAPDPRHPTTWRRMTRSAEASQGRHPSRLLPCRRRASLTRLMVVACGASKGLPRSAEMYRGPASTAPSPTASSPRRLGRAGGGAT